MENKLLHLKNTLGAKRHSKFSVLHYRIPEEIFSIVEKVKDFKMWIRSLVIQLK